MALLNFLIADPIVFLSVVLVVACLCRWLWVPSDRKRSEYIAVVTIYAVGMSTAANWFIRAISPIRPLKYDLYIFRLDAWLGQPSFRIGAVLFRHPSLVLLLSAAYQLLPLACVGVFIVYLYKRPEDLRLLISAFIATTVLALPFYLAVPVCGPFYAFAGFPAIPALSSLHAIPLAAAPNAIPSVHMATALLIFWFLRWWSAGRIAGAIFLVLTTLATLGGGQHYAFDLLCAVPYTIGVYLLCKRGCGRYRARESTEESAASVLVA